MKSLLLAVSMFTKIPIRKNVWREDLGPSALCFIFVAGLIAGSVTAAVYYFLTDVLSNMLNAAAVVLSMYAVCGFLHIDGYMDVCDALLSSRSNEQKAVILKDSNVGAFSVVSVVLLIMVLYAASYELINAHVSFAVFIFIPALSRAFCAILAFSFRPMSDKGLLVFFRSGMKSGHVVESVVIFTFVLVVGFIACGLVFTVVSIISLVATILFAFYINHVFNGINGDVVGFLIVVNEALTYFIYASCL